MISEWLIILGMREVPTETSKVRYWYSRALSHLREMRVAKLAGLFPKREGWSNVVEHELVEAEAVDVLAEMLGLPGDERESLNKAASLHDVYKRKEREWFKQFGVQGAHRAEREQTEFLRDQDYDDEVIRLTQLVGGYALGYFIEDLGAAKLQLKKDLKLSELIIHYIDDVTLNSDLVTLEERAAYVKKRYKEEDEKARELFAGRTGTKVMLEIGRQIEERLANMVGVYPPEGLPKYIKQKILERIEARWLEGVGMEAANAAAQIFQELGERGKRQVGVNRFGEPVLLADLKCEEVVLNVLKKSGLPIKVICEEHGEVVLGEGEPKYLAVLDGIDGTRQYLSEDNPYRVFGTLLGIFGNTDPKYKEAIASFAMEHSAQKLFIALKHQGTFMLKDGKRERIILQGPSGVSPSLKMFGDAESRYTKQLSSYRVVQTNSAAQNFIALLRGSADVVSLYTLKGNLEEAVFYLMIKEAGGVMIKSDDGRNLGDEKYLEFGRGEDHQGIVACATPQLASAILGLA